MSRSGGVYRAPTVIDTVRMNLSVAERAVENGDVDTVRRSIEASERIFAGLREVYGGKLGTSLASLGDDEPTPVVAPPAAVVAPVVVPPVAAPVVVVPEVVYSLRLLASVTWQWWKCAAVLLWRGGRRLVKGGGRSMASPSAPHIASTTALKRRSRMALAK